MTATITDNTAAKQAAELMPVSGIVDARGNQAFVRTAGYRRSKQDLVLPQSSLRRYDLRTGDHLDGLAKPPRSGQGKGAAGGILDQVLLVNGAEPRTVVGRPQFEELTPVYPDERLRLESEPASATARIVDLLSPIGKGQRGLIVAAPKAGKTMMLTAIAQAIASGHPEVQLIVVLVGERPEEVTDLRRSIRGEVIYSTFDQSADDHIMVAELAIERAKRLVELGGDVVVLLDSITRLGRAYNLAAPASSRTLAGGVAAAPPVPRCRPQYRGRRLADHLVHRPGRDRVADGRPVVRGVQGHRKHGGAAASRPRRAAALPRDRCRPDRNAPGRPAHGPRRAGRSREPASGSAGAGLPAGSRTAPAQGQRHLV